MVQLRSSLLHSYFANIGGFAIRFPDDRAAEAVTEIDDYGGETSVGRHAFYIYNPTTSAEVVFK